MGETPRKIVFIDRKFQTEFILKFLLLILAGTAVFDLAAYLILDRRLEKTYYSAHIVIKSVGEILLPILLMLSVVFILVLGTAAFIITLYVSHHIAGPLFAIRRYLEKMAAGDLNFEARLRSGDQTTPLAQALALSVDTLNARLVAIRGGLERTREATQALAAHMEGGQADPDRCCREAGNLVAGMDEMVREIEFFRLRPPAQGSPE